MSDIVRVTRCLSLIQPWATLVAIGAKKVETRSWKTPYRGWLAIHASKAFPKDAQLERPDGRGPVGHRRGLRPHGAPERRAGIRAVRNRLVARVHPAARQMISSPTAVLSDCRRYRYRIECNVALSGIVIAFFGVNPSDAETGLHDQTTRKWTGFAQLLGARLWVAGNPFAWRTPDVRELALVDDPVGPDNDAHLEQIIAEADILVPCWGAIAKVPPSKRPRVAGLRLRLLESGKPVKVFGLTRCHQPKHPLMLGYNTNLLDWKP